MCMHRYNCQSLVEGFTRGLSDDRSTDCCCASLTAQHLPQSNSCAMPYLKSAMYLSDDCCPSCHYNSMLQKPLAVSKRSMTVRLLLGLLSTITKLIICAILHLGCGHDEQTTMVQLYAQSHAATAWFNSLPPILGLECQCTSGHRSLERAIGLHRCLASPG